MPLTDLQRSVPVLEGVNVLGTQARNSAPMQTPTRQRTDMPARMARALVRPC